MNAVSFRPHYLFAWLYLIIFSAALSAREVIVIGGTGSGSYPRDDSVTITANSASGRRAMSNSQNSGMVFLRWWSFNQTTSEMGLYRETEPQQTFVPTGNHRVEMAAVSGKIQVICPPLAPDAPNQFSILSPKSAENPSKRYPLEIHVTLAGYDRADPADIFKYLKVGASWFPTPEVVGIWGTNEIASFWDASEGGTEITKDGFVKNELFTAEGSKLIAKIWYQPLWTREQLKSEENPDGKEKLPNLSFKATLFTTAMATDYRMAAQVVSVNLPSVEIKITEKDKSPPTHGVCVKAGTNLEYKLSDSDLGLPASAITWKSSQLKGNGTYTAWTNFGAGGAKMDYTVQTNGIFKVRATINAGGSNIDIDYLRSKDEPNATSDSSGAYNEFFRAGKPDFVGVVEDAPQLALRDQARGS